MWLFSALVIAVAQEREPDTADLLRAGPTAARPQAVEPAFRYNVTRPRHVDRRSVSDLAVGATDLFHLGLRDDGGDAWSFRAVKWSLSLWFGAAATHVVHEYGHISSFSRAGFHSVRLGEVGAPPQDSREATLGRLFVDGLGSSAGHGLRLSEDDWAELKRRFEGRPRDFNRFWLTVEAGGLNQEQALASRYARRLQEDRLSRLDAPSYLWASLATIRYSATIEDSDITDYLTSLNQEGRDVSVSRLKALSGLRLLGGTGLVGWRAAVEGVLGSDGGFVEPLSVEPIDELRVCWPEFESYLTVAGPTLKTELPLRPGAWLLLPSYERSFASGGVDHEGGLRARVPFFDGLLWLDAASSHGDRGGRWHAAEAELRPLAWLSLLVGGEAGRGYTFRRDVFGAKETFVDGSERSLLLGLRITLAF